MPGIEDWINHPLSTIQRIFDDNEKACAQAVKEYFTQRVSDEKALSWIPSLNDTPLHNLKTNTLVKYRCMIQDMYDPEFYLGVYEVADKASGATSLHSGMYRDLAECQAHQEVRMNSTKNVTMDRQTFYCVPIPGENEWAKKAWSQQNVPQSVPSTSSGSRTKRSLDEAGDAVEPDAVHDTEMSASNGAGVTGPDDGSKRTRTDQQAATSSKEGPDLNFPLPGEKGPACLVKIYEDAEQFKLNETIEFIGVLSNDPAMVSFPEQDGSEISAIEGESMDTMDDDARSPPPSLVPRLHAILAHRQQHNNPLLPRNIPVQNDADLGPMLEGISNTTKELLTVLEQVCLGDKLAATYFMCHLVSCVYARRDVVALGKYGLNLGNCPKDYPTHLYSLLQDMVTKSHFIPMSLENLNSGSFVPRKDYSANRLHSGQLQLSEGTHLVLDETAMQAGQLDTIGVKNVTALGNVITWQKVEYDFNFHKQDFSADAAVLVLSEGKSLLKCDCHVPLQPTNQTANLENVFSAIKAGINGTSLEQYRKCLTVLRLLPYDLPADVQKVVEEDFVNARKEDPNRMTVDDFHALLILARLLSVSQGQRQLSLETWHRAKQLERERKQRLTSTTS